MKFLFLLLMCVACGGDNFRKVERLETFRGLGIVADTPEVAEGAIVTVNALVSDVNGSSATFPGSYELCIDPGISRGAPVTCDFDPGKLTGSYDIPTAGFTNRTGLGPDLTFTIPPILTGRSSTERQNGVGYLVILTFTVDGEEHQMFKRILVSTRAPDKRNTNPQIGNILINGSVIGAPPLDGDKISLTVGSPETYQVINADGSVETRTETFEVAWYTNSGKFDKPKARADETVEFQGDRPDFIMAVIRDERGGLDFRIFP
jgi:hypothetical protein